MTITTRSPGASGCLFVVAAPSGGGKSSMVNALLEREPGIRLSVSYTTRPPRPGEFEGNHYHFVDVATFTALKDRGEFLEHAFVHGNWYATSATWLRAQVAAGQDVLLEIDWQGAAQIRKLKPESVGIFVLPPTIEVLEARLRGRAQDSPDVIAARLAAARGEISHAVDFDYVIINDDFDRAAQDLIGIVRAERLRLPRQLARHANLIKRLTDA